MAATLYLAGGGPVLDDARRQVELGLTLSDARSLPQKRPAGWRKRDRTRRRFVLCAWTART
jgi:hypothetical protein